MAASQRVVVKRAGTLTVTVAPKRLKKPLSAGCGNALTIKVSAAHTPTEGVRRVVGPRSLRLTRSGRAH